MCHSNFCTPSKLYIMVYDLIVIYHQSYFYRSSKWQINYVHLKFWGKKTTRDHDLEKDLLISEMEELSTFSTPTVP